MLQYARVTGFSASELLKKNQQRGEKKLVLRFVIILFLLNIMKVLTVWGESIIK